MIDFFNDTAKKRKLVLPAAAPPHSLMQSTSLQGGVQLSFPNLSVSINAAAANAAACGAPAVGPTRAMSSSYASSSSSTEPSIISPPVEVFKSSINALATQKMGEIKNIIKTVFSGDERVLGAQPCIELTVTNVEFLLLQRLRHLNTISALHTIHQAIAKSALDQILNVGKEYHLPAESSSIDALNSDYDGPSAEVDSALMIPESHRKIQEIPIIFSMKMSL